MKKIEIVVPTEFSLNPRITFNNEFIVNEDAIRWREIKFPLPEGNWSIYSVLGNYKHTKVILIDNE